MPIGTEFTGTGQLTGFTYEIYDKLVNLVPDSARAIRKIPYKGADKELGSKFHQNVIVSDEAGFTHAASGDGAFAIQGAVSMTTQDAQVDGYQLVLQSSLDYEAAARASSSRKAYAAIAETKLKNMVESTRRRLENEIWYGQRPLGLIASTTAASGGATTATIVAAEHAPFIWGGKRGFKVIATTAADGDVTGIASGSGGYFEIKSVNVADDVRTVTLQEAVSGDAADLKTYVDANPNVVRLYWYTGMTVAGPTFKTMAGIDKIVPNTGSLFNIDAAVYDLWAGNDFDVGSVALTFKKVIDSLAAAANRGMDENATLWVHHRAWSNLAADQAGLRRYGGEVSAKQGFSSIKFHHMTGEVEIVGHGMVKAGYAYLLPMKHFSRVGAQDVSFKTPGRNPGDDIFWHDPTKAGFSYRLYTHQAVFCDQPAKCVRLKNIVNT